MAKITKPRFITPENAKELAQKAVRKRKMSSEEGKRMARLRWYPNKKPPQ